MDNFLRFIYENSKRSSNPYECGEYVSFNQLEEESFSKTDIFSYIEEGLEKGLIAAGRNADDIFAKRRVSLSAKGRYYLSSKI